MLERLVVLLGVTALMGMVLLAGEMFPVVVYGAFWLVVLLVVAVALWEKRKENRRRGAP